MVTVTYDELMAEFVRVLVSRGFDVEVARKSATIFADTTLDGVPSHGVNRFPRVINYIEKGYIDPKAKPTKIASFGALEKWDGNLGMGNVNASIVMDRAIELAKENGVGVVALRNTNHWMRGSTYGLQAAERGYGVVCWTNTQPNMPAWGSVDRKIGNNPLVIAIPRKDGIVIFDAAMSQYSYGKIEATKLAGKQLPFPGGYNTKGELTADPGEIMETWRVLPIGLWKGSGLSIVLDLLAAVLSEGKTTCKIGSSGDDEYGLSQIFIAFDMYRISSREFIEEQLQASIDDLKNSVPISAVQEVRYPGEGTLNRRIENLKKGIRVDEGVWRAICAL